MQRRFLTVLLFVAISVESEATDVFWIGGNGIFSTVSEWADIPLQPDRAAGPNDVAHFGTNDTSPFLVFYTVNFTTDPTNQAFVVADDNVTFDLNGHVYILTASNPIILGTSSIRTGGLTITDGNVAVTSENSNLLLGGDGAGFLTVTTGGLLAGSAMDMVVGFGGNGTLTVNSGGDIIAEDTFIAVGSGRTGTATITGSGSALLTTQLSVGHVGTGTLNITASGDVESSSGVIGNLAASVGTATVNGSLSDWDVTGPLTVGDAGTGTLNITAGGRVDSDSGIVGDEVGSTGTVNVDGIGSKWVNSDGLSVGYAESGTLSITGGGQVQSTGFSSLGELGALDGAAGTAMVTVDGANSQWINTGDLDVGRRRAGTLTITAGGRVESANATIGTFAGANGSAVTVAGAGSNGVSSLWMNSGGLTVGSASHGTLSITAGGQVHSAGGTIGAVNGAALGSGEVTVSGPGSRWVNSDGLAVGYSGSGTLRITGGGQVQSTGFSSLGELGALDGAAGTAMVTVDGANSQWINTGDLDVGRRRAGTLTITAGGRVESANATIGTFAGANGSAVTVAGAGSNGVSSLWMNSGGLTVGSASHGTLSITAGGQVHSAGGTIGAVNGAALGSGEVTVSGPGSRWVNSDGLAVGYSGSGTLRITGGGQVQSTGFSSLGELGGPDGAAGTAMVTVDGANSQWTNTGDLDVGRRRAGTLTITAGGRVENASATIGSFSGANGSAVTVAGAGSTWDIGGQLGVGGVASSNSNGGTGTLRIQLGGTVSVTQGTHLWDDDNLILEGGTLSTSEIQMEGPIGFNRFFWSSGTLHVGFFDGASLDVPNGGILAPGNSVGTTTTQFDYASLPGATTEIEIAGTVQGTEYDFVNILNNAILVGGNLQLVRLGGFVPNAVDTFTILAAAGNIAGAYANVTNGQRLTTIDGLGSFLVHYGAGSTFDPSQIVLSNFLAAAVPGDYNQDGTVNAADYTVWRDHVGQTFTLTNEKPSAATPGVVDEEDYAFWKSNFGQTLGSGSGTTATVTVPEPTTLVMLILAAAGWCLQRSRAL